jgi:hypothetical protein
MIVHINIPTSGQLFSYLSEHFDDALVNAFTSNFPMNKIHKDDPWLNDPWWGYQVVLDIPAEEHRRITMLARFSNLKVTTTTHMDIEITTVSNIHGQQTMPF